MLFSVITSLFIVTSSARLLSTSVLKQQTDCSTCLGLISPIDIAISDNGRNHLASCSWCSGHNSKAVGPEIFQMTGMIGVCVNSSKFCPSKTYDTHVCPNFFSGSWSPNSYWILLIVTVITSMIVGLFIGALVFIHNAPSAPLMLAVVSVFFPSAATFSAMSSVRQSKSAQKSTCRNVTLIALVISEVMLIFSGFFAGWMMDFYQFTKANCFLETPDCVLHHHTSPVPYTMMITLGMWYVVVFVLQPLRLCIATSSRRNKNVAQVNNINTIELDDERQNLLG